MSTWLLGLVNASIGAAAVLMTAIFVGLPLTGPSSLLAPVGSMVVGTPESGTVPSMQYGPAVVPGGHEADARVAPSISRAGITNITNRNRKIMRPPSGSVTVNLLSLRRRDSCTHIACSPRGLLVP